MFTRVVFLQPLGGTAETPPPAPPPTADADAGAGATGVDNPPRTDVNVNINVAVSQELCEKANSESVLATLGYSLGASLLAVVIFVVLEKKLVSSAGARMGIAAAIGALGAAALTHMDPARSDQFRLCLNDTGTAVYLTLASQPVARDLALGFAPALVLTLLLAFLVRRFFL